MDKSFKETLQELIDIMYKKHDNVIVVFQGDLDIETHAKAWTQSRTTVERDRAVEYLQSQGANKIAEIVEASPTLCGRWATNALPGTSWQNFGKGALLVSVVDGKTMWKRKSPVYEILAKEAVNLDLSSGFFFSLPDPQYVAAQRRSPLKEFGWKKIEKLLIP